jgi:hypothetical protein
VTPHYGVLTGTVESLFVAMEHRECGAGIALLRAAKTLARDLGAAAMFVSSPAEGRLAKVLSASGYRETNRIFMVPL